MVSMVKTTYTMFIPMVNATYNLPYHNGINDQNNLQPAITMVLMVKTTYTIIVSMIHTIYSLP